MYKILKKGLPFLLLIAIPFVSAAQEKTAGSTPLKQISFSLDGKTIALEDYIKLLLTNNNEVLSTSYQLFMTDTEYEKFQKKYSIYINGEANASRAKYPSALASQTGKTVNDITGTVSATKTFSSGTTLTAGLQHEFKSVEGYVTGGKTVDYKYHQPVAFVSLQQELLKNAFGKSDRNTEKIMKNEAEITKASAEMKLTAVVTQGIVDYWSYVISKNAFENAKMKYDETVRVRNIVRSNVSLGLAESFDLSYYNALVAGSEADVAMTEQSYRDAVRTIFTSLNLDGDEKKLGDIKLVEDKYTFQEESYLSLAYKQRADYLAAKLGYDNAKLRYSNYQNGEAPSLLASVGASSMGIDDSVSKPYGDVAVSKYPTFEAGINMSYPLGDPELKVNLRDSKYKVEQARLDLDKSQKDVRDAIKSGIESVSTSYSVMKSSDRSRSEIETYYAQLLTNLRRGRLNSTTVKNALDARADSRQRSLEAKINYNIKLIQLEISANNLLASLGIKPKGEIKGE